MSKYYTLLPSVIDGDVAYADDVNDLNTAVNASFTSVQSDFDNVVATVSVWSDLAQQWSSEVEDTEVEPGLYSALHHAAKALASALASASSASAASSSASSASSSKTAAALSETNAGLSETATAADLVLTNADVVSTNADVVLTNADVVSTNADVLLTNADVLLTHADVVLTHADVLLTHADVILTHADAASTAQDALDTAADLVLTNADVVSTNADAASTAQDALDTAADLVLTNADVVSTNADAANTAQDALDTAADVVLTNADVVSTNADAATTAQDAIDTAADAATTAQDALDTAADVVSTNADVVLTNADVTYSAEWANKAEDSLISVAAGGDGVDDYSALHSAAKAAADLVLTNADVVLTHADVVLTNADVATLANKIERTSATGSAVMPKGTEAQRDATPLSGYMRFNTDEATFEGHDGTEWGAIGGGGGLTWSVVTASTTAEDANGYIVDTSTGTKTLTLPATPTVGMTVGYKDLNGYFGTAPLVIDGNGANIQGLSEDLVVNSNNAGGTLVYSDATEGWVLTSSTPLQTIQSKPFMHVQDQKASGVAGGTSVIGNNGRDLNTILVNEISGASLATNQVTLPAGEYYIDAVSLFNNTTTTSSKTYVFVDGASALGGNHQNQDTSDLTNQTRVSGKIVLSSSSIITVVTWVSAGRGSFGLGGPSNSDKEVYTDLKIWRLDMDKVYPNLSDPSVALSKPLMHVQDQKASGTKGGNSSSGDNDRVLNTILINEISGASLSSNEVTLPAGTYYIDAISTVENTGIARQSIRKADGTVLLSGVRGDSGSMAGECEVSGQITLAIATAIKTVTTCGSATTDGLGYLTNLLAYEVFTDLKIWQLDAVTQTLITRQPINQPITGAYTTGDIFGGELEYVDATTFNVKPVSTYSDDLTTSLFINSTTLVDLGAPAINTIYNAFLVKNSDLSYDVLVDTDVNGANLPGTVSYKRWLGFVLTDASGDIIDFDMSGDFVVFTNRVNIGALGTSSALYSFSSFCPITRIKEYEVIAQGNDNSGSDHRVVIQDKDTSSILASMGTNRYDDYGLATTTKDGIRGYCTANTGVMYIRATRLKR